MSRVLCAFHNSWLAFEPEDLPGVIMEAMRRQRLEGGGLRREGIKSPILGLVEGAVKEMVERRK